MASRTESTAWVKACREENSVFGEQSEIIPFIKREDDVTPNVISQVTKPRPREEQRLAQATQLAQSATLGQPRIAGPSCGTDKAVEKGCGRVVVEGVWMLSWKEW